MDLQFIKRDEPILVNSELYFETKAVYNPTVIKKDEKFYILYRAESYDHISGYIGLAWSNDGIHFTKHTKPVLAPEFDFEENGCEDPRVVAFDGTYYMTYVPLGSRTNGVNIALAASTDLFHWEKRGVIKMTLSDWCSDKVKAPVIAPVKINGKYILYFMGQTQSWHTAIGVAYSYDLIHWTQDVRNPILIPRHLNLDSLGIEPGPTPIIIDNRIALFYNAWDDTLTHRTWYASFDIDDPGKLCERSDCPILSPEYSWECDGYARNVVFAEGIVEHNNHYYMYYGASDTSIGLALCKIENK